MLDLLEQLKDNIRGLGLEIVQNINTEDDSIAIAALPGGRVIQEYYGGMKDKELNYEIRGKTKDPKKTEEELTQISDHLTDLQALPSLNGSYEFIGVTVSDEPYFLEADDQAFFHFALGFSVRVTVF